MSKNLIVVIVAIGSFVFVGTVIFFSSSNKNSEDSMMVENDTMMEDSDAMKDSDAMDDSSMTDDSMVKSATRYVDYSSEAFAEANESKRVYFFHASWCPTCKVANEEFSSNGDSIPEDIVLFKTDYDSSSELKKRYAVTYQHTFVQVDENGNEITKWNGGGIAELSKNTK